MKALTFSLALLLALPTQANDGLPKAVAQQLKNVGIPTANVAVVVQEAGAKRPSLQHNADVAMNPASVMKLVTTYAGLLFSAPPTLGRRGLMRSPHRLTVCSMAIFTSRAVVIHA
jgi:serine-type D-Ala-D-Ala carboxypeptidase/endopeptidase (penicillin-binding protein 4)